MYALCLLWGYSKHTKDIGISLTTVVLVNYSVWKKGEGVVGEKNETDIRWRWNTYTHSFFGSHNNEKHNILVLWLSHSRAKKTQLEVQLCRIEMEILWRIQAQILLVSHHFLHLRVRIYNLRLCPLWVEFGKPMLTTHNDRILASMYLWMHSFT